MAKLQKHYFPWNNKNIRVTFGVTLLKTIFMQQTDCSRLCETIPIYRKWELLRHKNSDPSDV